MPIVSLLIILILLFALFETPIFTIIAAVSVVLFYTVDFDFQALQTILIELNRLASMPILVALPLFTLTGCILTETKAPQRVMNIVQALIGWLPGGLAIAALVSCAFFTALTGASGVTIVALGSILYPILREHHYNEYFSLGLVTTSGSLGLLFPPSLPVILYGVVAQVDIGQAFSAALIPGILLVVILAGYAVVHEAMRKGKEMESPAKDNFSWTKLLQAFWQGKWEWPVVIIILTGVYGGFVTIAEVSALVLVYVIVVECFVLNEINFFRQLPGIMVEAALFSGAIIVILGMALGFTGYLVDEQIPNRILHTLTELTSNRYLFLAGLNVFLLAVGCIMDIFSAIVIIVPIIVPIAISYGIDPLHLCVIFLVNLEMGYSTPPVGINLFISSLRFDKSVTTLYRASIPYLILLFIVLMMVTYIPFLSLWNRI
ncbi:MAG: TRAP transporter large permease subunit [Desulfobacteraceae bacterium]|jgi:tripartite ATP-independent transporter DctM subunit